jgi:hypothetical protein
MRISTRGPGAGAAEDEALAREMEMERARRAPREANDSEMSTATDATLVLVPLQVFF